MKLALNDEMKNAFTDREKHALYEGLMMPVSWLFHKRIPLTEDHYASIEDSQNETHYVQLGETITVVGVLGTIAIAWLIWRKHANRNG